MSYVVRISYQDRIWNVDLSDRTTASIGSSGKDTVQILVDGVEKSQVSFSRDETGAFSISGNSLFRIVDGENSPVFFEKIALWNMYCIDAADEIFITIHPKQSDWNRMISIHDRELITIGRSRGNLIMLKNGRTSGRHCEIYRRESEFYIKDLGSTNGTFVNGFRVVEDKLHDGDWIALSIYQILFQNGYLYLFNTGRDISTELKTEEVSLVQAVQEPIPKWGSVHGEETLAPGEKNPEEGTMRPAEKFAPAEPESVAAEPEPEEDDEKTY